MWGENLDFFTINFIFPFFKNEFYEFWLTGWLSVLSFVKFLVVSRGGGGAVTCGGWGGVHV